MGLQAAHFDLADPAIVQKVNLFRLMAIMLSAGFYLCRFEMLIKPFQEMDSESTSATQQK